MAGMNDRTGTALGGLAHIEQSVADILTTPLGTRVMRREYGSLLPDIIDQPLNDANLLRLYAAAVIALARWEPRIRVNTLGHRIDAGQPGHASLIIDAQTVEGQPVSLEVPLR
ncbi:GPW/gp25 family protein [Modicisalibacter sp. MOD 31.J]|uniref:GPW/gp25 family protein n=1 Tax=Modicisalibacter sp. MOD 31.J TaxID=2831897 RepID=UPI001CCC0845|nr:GPW/gp25 family protein [Modicisalibacter sp. MOD 31.J]MBZ9576726.1 GPW/gp25 family protein [Modicisalibacter sp. MOD 31.J]